MQSRNSIECLKICIRLRGVSPPVWRRLIVPTQSTIAELHRVIQAAMGWEDIHLHRFEIRGESYGVWRPGSVGFRTNAGEVRLIDFAFRERERFSYIYDFTSHWRHDVRVEKVGLSSRGPRCIAGQGACPPESSGGPRLFHTTSREYDASQFACDVAELLDAETMTDEEFRDSLGDVLEEWRLWLDRLFDQRAINTALEAIGRGDHESERATRD